MRRHGRRRASGVSLGSSAERRYDAHLLEYLQQVQFVPVFDEHAVRDAPDVDGAHLYRMTARRDAHEVAGVGPAVDEATYHAVTGDHQVLHGGAQVRQGSEELGPELSVRLTAVGN